MKAAPVSSTRPFTEVGRAILRCQKGLNVLYNLCITKQPQTVPCWNLFFYDCWQQSPDRHTLLDQTASGQEYNVLGSKNPPITVGSNPRVFRQESGQITKPVTVDPSRSRAKTVE